MLKRLQPFFSWEEIRQAHQQYKPLTLTTTDGEEISVINYLTHTVLKKENFEYSHYVIFADPQMGKTALCLQLFRRYGLGWGKDFQMKLVSLSHPDALKSLKDVENPENWVALIDGWDEDVVANENYKLRMDEVLEATKDFSKVLVTCRKGFFPAHVEGPAVSPHFKYTGEAQFQLFAKLYLNSPTPYQIKSILRPQMLRLNAEGRLRIKELRNRLPLLFDRVGILRNMETFGRSGRDYQFRFEQYGAMIHDWIGKESKKTAVKERLFAFASQVAMATYENGRKTGTWRLQKKIFESIAEENHISLRKMSNRIMISDSDGNYRFIHHSFLGYLVAWNAFHEEWTFDKTHFPLLPDALIFFREMCWKAYLEEVPNTKGYYRTWDRLEKKPIEGLSFEELAQVNRLYLMDFQNRDLRFLRGIKGLTGLYLFTSDWNDFPESLLYELPHTRVMIYHVDGSLIRQVYHLSQGDWIPYDPDGGLSPRFPVEHPLGKGAGRNNLDHLFHVDLSSLPNGLCHKIGEGDSEDEIHYVVYELHLGLVELEIFNQAWIYVFEDGTRNLILSNNYQPTLIARLLEGVINRLVKTFGEDDRHIGAFSLDDEAQIEDGHWIGRRWAWGNTDAYAHPVQIFMDQAGEITLGLYGLAPKTVNDPTL